MRTCRYDLYTACPRGAEGCSECASNPGNDKQCEPFPIDRITAIELGPNDQMLIECGYHLTEAAENRMVADIEKSRLKGRYLLLRGGSKVKGVIKAPQMAAVDEKQEQPKEGKQ